MKENQMKRHLLCFCAIFFAVITASATLNIQTLRRQCYWSEKGGTVTYDVLKKSCDGDSCLYKKVAVFNGSDFQHSEQGYGLYGTGRDVPYLAVGPSAFSYQEEREKLRSQCYDSTENYCKKLNGKVEVITTKLGTFEACLTEHDYLFSNLKLWSVPYLPFYSFLRMEYRGLQYDLNNHPMFNDPLKNIPPVKASERCFEVYGKKYCLGGRGGSSNLVMAGSMDRIDAILGLAYPGLYDIVQVTPDTVKLEKTEAFPFKTIEISIRDIGMYIVQKKCVHGICPGAQIRVEQPYNNSSLCQYSPNGSINEFQKKFEFVGVLGNGNNYSEVWKVLDYESIYYYTQQYESWPNSSDVLNRGGLGWSGSCLVKMIKK